MSKRSRLIFVCVVVVVVAAAGILSMALLTNRAEDRYEKEAVLAWTDLLTDLSAVSDAATKRNRQEQYDVDFTALLSHAQDVKRKIDEQKTFWEVKRAPGKFREFNIAFVDLLGKASAAVQALIDNSLIWSDGKMYDLRVKISELIPAQNSAFNAWPAGRKALLAADQKIFANVATASNTTRLARKKAEEVERIARTNAEEQTQQKNQRISDYHDSAVEEMRAIMSEYIQARNYFNTMMEVGVRDPMDFGEQCVANRYALISRLENLDLPNGFYQETKRLFISGINDAIEAIRIKCQTGNGHSAAAARAASKIRKVQTRLGM